MDVGDIPGRWEELSGSTDWKDLIEPLDNDLRHYLIQYGERVQATYDAFNSEVVSKNAGSCRYDKKDLFSRVGLVMGNPFEYEIVKYFYATSQVSVPAAFILKSLSREAWSKESNWMGYIAVATDKGKAALGRRDILVAWRGSVQAYEWINDFDFSLVPSGKLFGDAGVVGIHRGWLSIYTSDDPKSPFVKTSARDQVISELQRLMKLYKDDEISITITGHSMGAAVGTLNAVDIVANNINRPQDDSKTKKPCPVTAFLFASPRVGTLGFRELVQRLNQLHILRVTNKRDVVPTQPPKSNGYIDVGTELSVDSIQSNYLNSPGDFKIWHDLEVYLHMVAGTHGDKEEFKLDSMKRDLALVNKYSDALKRELLVPHKWWCERHKGMVQNSDGTWKLEDELHLDTIGE